MEPGRRAGGSSGASAAIARVPTQPTARPAAPNTAPVPRGRWWTTSLLLMLAFMVLGVAPLALTARLLAPPGFNLPGLGSTGLFAPTATATTADLSLPRAAWVSRLVNVRDAVGSSTVVAQLRAGFPVQIQAHATAKGTPWDRIIWAGPTPATGGQGWVPDNALSPIGGTGAAVGDAGALAPGLLATLQSLGPNIGLAVYYPAAQQLYLTNGDQPLTLGYGARSLLLAALIAAVASGPPTTPTAVATAQTTPSPPPTLTDAVARGDATATALAYQQIGGSAGLAAFVGAYGLAGVTPGATDWTQTQASPRALAQFYAALANLIPAPDYGQLNSAGRTHTLALLAASASAAPADVAPLLVAPVPNAHMTLVVGTGQDGNGWTLTAAGIVALPNNVTYVIAAGIHNVATRAAAEQAVLAMLTSVATITQG